MTNFELANDIVNKLVLYDLINDDDISKAEDIVLSQLEMCDDLDEIGGMAQTVGLRFEAPSMREFNSLFLHWFMEWDNFPCRFKIYDKINLSFRPFERYQVVIYCGSMSAGTRNGLLNRLSLVRFQLPQLGNDSLSI